MILHVIGTRLRYQILLTTLLVVVALGLCIAGCGEKGARKRSTFASKATNSAPILLFCGKGTSPNDVSAFEMVLKSHSADYEKANTSALNRMDAAKLRSYSLLMVPGGNFLEIGNGLSPQGRACVQNAVAEGLNYLGVCAGAFVAGSRGSNSLNLVKVNFKFYAAEDRGVRKAVVPIALAEGRILQHYWEDGPQMTGWGLVVGKYADGTPAIVEGRVGKGWVVLSGVHAEAPATWRRGMPFTTPVEVDNEHAWTLVKAARDGVSMPHF
jgi:glutamine amidotransferase-like uncharacterized protein